jgi:hypothetical protein
MGLRAQLKHAFNAFLDQDPVVQTRPFSMGAGYGVRPDRIRGFVATERSIISSVYTKIAVDGALVDMRHVRLDDQDRYKEDILSGLHDCLNVEANLDQNAFHFMMDLIMSLMEEGTIAVLPVETDTDPAGGGSVNIKTMRVAKIVEWFPRHVRIEAYNEITGRREQLTRTKTSVAIIENPLLAVMNEPNSTLQRLLRKLALLDRVDEQASSGKLDLIIQLPYQVKTESRRKLAKQRTEDIEFQLTGSKYGIAYADATEKITQLNRPVENNLLTQVTGLRELYWAELGISKSVMDGTADEAAMLNYNNRVLTPILESIAQEFKRKFLSKTARTQKQSIMYFRDPFKLVPMKDLAELADKLTRNEIVTKNEFRGFIGMRPSDDPKADMLQNANMPYADPEAAPAAAPAEEAPEGDAGGGDVFASVNSTLDDIFKELGVEE